MGTLAGVNSRSRARRARIAWTVAATAAIGVAGVLALDQPVRAQVNIEEIFWCEGKPIGDQTPEECVATRDLILSACTSCHMFSPIVLTQRTEDEWGAFFDRHRGRVGEMSDADYEGIWEFVTVHFNPDNPVPVLPEVLMNYTLPPD